LSSAIFEHHGEHAFWVSFKAEQRPRSSGMSENRRATGWPLLPYTSKKSPATPRSARELELLHALRDRLGLRRPAWRGRKSPFTSAMITGTAR